MFVFRFVFYYLPVEHSGSLQIFAHQSQPSFPITIILVNGVFFGFIIMQQIKTKCSSNNYRTQQYEIVMVNMCSMRPDIELTHATSSKCIQVELSNNSIANLSAKKIVSSVIDIPEVTIRKLRNFCYTLECSMFMSLNK